jgi:hypothetical protein
MEPPLFYFYCSPQCPITGNFLCFPPGPLQHYPSPTQTSLTCHGPWGRPPCQGLGLIHFLPASPYLRGALYWSCTGIRLASRFTLQEGLLEGPGVAESIRSAVSRCASGLCWITCRHTPTPIENHLDTAMFPYKRAEMTVEQGLTIG